jgi:hypothetical protein
MRDSTPRIVSHTWKVGAFTVTLTASLGPGTEPAHNAWHPFQPVYFTPGMEAEYLAGLHTAIAKFRAAIDQDPRLLQETQ